MKIKHLLLIPIVMYLGYLIHHAFTVTFQLESEDIETSFDTFAGVITSIVIGILILSIPFILIFLKEETTVFKRINKFINRRIL